MKGYSTGQIRFHHVCLLLLLFLALPATGFCLDNSYKNTDLGFQFYPPGARALGMGGAFVGLADDATAAASNPGGLAQLTHMQLAVEGRWVSKDSTSTVFPWFTQSSSVANAFQTTQASVDDATEISFAAFTTPVFNNLFNISLFYDKPMSFNADKLASRGLLGGPVLEHEPNSTDISIDEAGFTISKSFVDGRVMLGASVGVQVFDFQQREAGFLPPTAALPYYTHRVDKDDLGFSYRAGVLVKPLDNLRIGGEFTHMPKFDYTLKQHFLGTPEVQFDSTFNMPDNFAIGAAYNIFPNWVVVFEARYIMYNQLMDGFVVPYAYPDSPVVNGFSQRSSALDYDIDNVMEIHFGTEYVLNVIPNVPIALRAGLFFEPAHDLKYSRPDGVATRFNRIEANLFDGGDDLMHYTLGTGVVLFNHLQVDVGADWNEDGQRVALSLVYQF